MITEIERHRSIAAQMIKTFREQSEWIMDDDDINVELKGAKTCDEIKMYLYGILRLYTKGANNAANNLRHDLEQLI